MHFHGNSIILYIITTYVESINRRINLGENINSIKSVSTLEDMKESWSEITSSVMMMVYVITVVACLLAIGVLYNLGILSFTEMEREVATLKVLGFKTNFLKKVVVDS